jgi:NitT/TauT family transport system substrate-binding protein
LIAAAAINESEYLQVRKRGIQLVILADLRDRKQIRALPGVDEYPTTVLIAHSKWLEEHPATARALARAIRHTVQWLQTHTASEVVRKLPPRYRSDAETDTAAVATVLPLSSSTGAMPREGADAVRRLVAGSVEKVRTSTFDLATLYTNEYLSR